MASDRCVWCGVRDGDHGAHDRFGKWWDEDAIEGMNSDVGWYRFGEFPLMDEEIRVEDRRVNRAGDTARLCQMCWRREYPECVKWDAADEWRRRLVERGQAMLPGVDV